MDRFTKQVLAARMEAEGLEKQHGMYLYGVWRFQLTGAAGHEWLTVSDKFGELLLRARTKDVSKFDFAYDGMDIEYIPHVVKTEGKRVYISYALFKSSLNRMAVRDIRIQNEEKATEKGMEA